MNQPVNRLKRVISSIILLILFVVVAAGLLLALVKQVYPVKYKDSVMKYSLEYSVDPYLVFSVIKAESNFKYTALSPRKAIGLMQITEDTGIWAAKKMKLDNFEVKDLYDPDINIRIGCWYLKYLENQFRNDKLGTEEEIKEFVLASYNGGRSNVLKWIKNIENNGTGLFFDSIAFKETKNYVKKVKGNYKIYKRIYQNL
ncbi:MAG: lytic transglycosylase domain-containing protein [Bacillota bacterium]|nr:lytic transglycosylase domain-containing protein [Bacillota bacterium]